MADMLASSIIVDTSNQPLTPTDHSRDAAGMTYVYPVVSRRAGGVSVGINLNPNNACNWRCIYCQVPELTRGTAPEIDLTLLEHELSGFLGELMCGDFMATRVPEDARRINDIALSGNGEPTSAKTFVEVIELIGHVMARFNLIGKIKLVLITNGSLVDKTYVQDGLGRMSALNGEVWFKLDSATRESLRLINHAELNPERVFVNLKIAAGLCPAWLQTCMFAMDNAVPSELEQSAYLDFIRRVVDEAVPVRGVLLYGLARVSQQPEAPRLSALPVEWLDAFAEKIRACGLPVKVSA